MIKKGELDNRLRGDWFISTLKPDMDNASVGIFDKSS